jgi:hypothetical protein
MLEEGVSVVTYSADHGPDGLNPARTIAEDALEDELQCISNLTSPPKEQPRALYFAYGSNLSYSQMRQRCKHDPEKSGKPLAVARLDHWRWLICERGYANVIPPEELRLGRQISNEDKVPLSREEDAVFGILYDMTPEDEYLLDGYEGIRPQFSRSFPSWKSRSQDSTP